MVWQSEVERIYSLQEIYTEGKRIRKAPLRQSRKTDDVIVRHDDDAAVNIVWEEVRDKARLPAHLTAFGNYIRHEFRGRPVTLISAEWAKAFYEGVDAEEKMKEQIGAFFNEK